MSRPHLEALAQQLRATLALVEAELADEGGRAVVHTVDDAAKILHMSAESVRRRIVEGRLDAVRDGKRWLIADETLRRYLTGQAG